MTGVPFELIKSNGEEYTCVKVYLKDNRYVYIGICRIMSMRKIPKIS